MKNIENHQDLVELALAERVAAGIYQEPTNPSEIFLTRASEAARRAEAVRKMRPVAEAIGFVPLGLQDYLAAVANRAQVNLVRALPSAGGSFASGWIKLARTLGIAADRIRLHLSLFIAERFEANSDPVLARNGNLRETSVRQLCGLGEEAVVEWLEHKRTTYDSATKAELGNLLREVDEI